MLQFTCLNKKIQTKISNIVFQTVVKKKVKNEKKILLMRKQNKLTS